MQTTETTVDIEANVDSEEVKIISGPSFWVMMMIALSDDAFDALATMAAMIPGFGLLVVGVFFLYSIVAGIIIFAYLYFKGVTFGQKILRRLILAIAIELIPLVSMLPATTFALMSIRTIHNHKITRNIAEILEQAENMKQAYLKA